MDITLTLNSARVNHARTIIAIVRIVIRCPSKAFIELIITFMNMTENLKYMDHIVMPVRLVIHREDLNLMRI